MIIGHKVRILLHRLGNINLAALFSMILPLMFPPIFSVQTLYDAPNGLNVENWSRS